MIIDGIPIDGANSTATHVNQLPCISGEVAVSGKSTTEVVINFPIMPDTVQRWEVIGSHNNQLKSIFTVVVFKRKSPDITWHINKEYDPIKTQELIFGCNDSGLYSISIKNDSKYAVKYSALLQHSSIIK